MEVIERLSPRDRMTAEEVDWYMSIGRSALRCIRVARLAVELRTVENILDFGCGHGRVMRFLKAKFPEAKLTACDLDADGVAFCAETFGATPVVSDPDPERIEINDSFDLIWCGSVLTHLDLHRWEGFLRLFASLLRPEGVCVFTTHGAKAAQIEGGKLLEQFNRNGFTYSAERNLSLSSTAVVLNELQKIPLRTVLLTEHGWNDHQDVFGATRRGGSGSCR